ncbi:MAG: site-specific DNA-methyltransferase [Candidatus Wallbacteria bacterium]|nr:site-specific DNA-methyltransferase [Candidatus Wallbacteria bacterium]
MTSPPYFRMRSYLPGSHPLKPLEIGLEQSLDLYVTHLMQVAHEIHRVLRDDGTFWLVIGDSSNSMAGRQNLAAMCGTSSHNKKSDTTAFSLRRGIGVRRKNILGVPWRLAFALQEDGWILRSEIIWHKPAPMPESVSDRPTRAHEQVFLLAKKQRYYYDADAIRDPYIDARENKAGARGGKTAMRGQAGLKPRGNMAPDASNLDRFYGAGGANIRDVWSIQPSPYRGKHCATFPAALAARCIAAGTSEAGCCPNCLAPWNRVTNREHRRGTDRKEGSRALVAFPGRPHRGLKNHQTAVVVRTLRWESSCACTTHKPIPCTVLDPFGGAGTTAVAAGLAWRSSLLIELDDASVAEARTRIRRELGLFAGSAAALEAIPA